MGPLPPPYFGQSVAFSTVVENFAGKHIIINTSNKNTVLSGIFLCVKILYFTTFYKIDIIYLTCSRSFLGSIRDVVLLFGARIRRIKVINHLHGADFKIFYDKLPKLYKKIVHWCYSGVDTNIVLFEELKSEFSDFPHTKIEVVPNAYSKDLDYLPLEKTKKKAEDKVMLLYCSNIMKSKGIINLLQAYEQVLQKYKNIELRIVGIPMKDYICSEEVITQEFNLNFERIKKRCPDNIFYYGARIGDEKKELLWDSDIFILPTFHFSEAFPLSVLEALRAGNYIITTNHNYLSRIISDENGRLIQPNSVSDIVESIEKIIFDRDLLWRTQNYNIQYARENYGEEQYVNNLCKIINSNLRTP